MLSIQDYYSDWFFKILYEGQTNKFNFKKNHVGAHDSDSITEADFTYTDVNSIFVSYTVGNDTTGDGTEALPYKTLLKGINETTVLKTYVIVLDSVLYVEDLSSATVTYFQGMYAATGETPTYTSRLLGYVPADANSIYFGKTSGTGGGAGTFADPTNTIALARGLTDGSHQNIVEVDGGTYTEPAFEMTGNVLGMYAANGVKPTFIPTQTDDNSDYTDVIDLKSITTFESGAAEHMQRGGTFSDGGFVIAYSDTDDGGKGKFVIFDKDGTETKAITEFEAGDTSYIAIGVFSNDEFVVVYADNTAVDGKFVIYDQEGTEKVSTTLFESNRARGQDVAVFSNNEFVITYWDDNVGLDGNFIIYDQDGVEQVSKTQFTSNALVATSTIILDTGNFAISYCDATDSYKGKLVIYNQAGVEQVSETVYANTGTGVMRSALLTGGDWVIFYNDNTSNHRKFVIYNSSGVEQVSAVTVCTTTGGIQGCTALLNGSFMVGYPIFDSSWKGRYEVFDKDGNQRVSATEFENGYAQDVTLITGIDGRVAIFYGDNSDSDIGRFLILYPYSWSGVKVSASSDINGWIIDGDDSYQLTKLIEVDGAKPTIKWCDFKDVTNPTTSEKKGFAVNGDNETDLYNCKIFDNDGGIYLTANVDDCLIHDSIFYRNDKAYAIHIDGAAASSGDITIEHNTIFQNFGGVRLENNNGTNEILKNNIIYDSVALTADTSVEISYSVLVGAYTNVTFGASLVRNNPLFINEGAIDEDDIDLNIKLRILGYSSNSPALNLADDSRDAGAYYVAQIGSAITWTEITLPKPLSLKTDVKFVGAKKSISRSGQVGSKKTGQTVYLAFQWSGLAKTYLEDLEDLLCQDDPDIQLYLMPITNPSTYESWKICWDNELSLSPKLWLHSDEGAEDVKLLLSRKYEVV